MQKVGEYIQKFNDITGQKLPCIEILQSDGLETHVRRRHLESVTYLPDIPDIIQSPDYIGKHPTEQDSIELVKTMTDNVMVCIKLAKTGDYFYVASLFKINPSKLQNRLTSGRLKIYL